MEFKSFVRVKELPKNGEITVRISDNVLEPEDWTKDHLVIRNDVVTVQIRTHQGAYDIPSMIGWSAKQLCEWSEYDQPASHPEQYHELYWPGFYL